MNYRFLLRMVVLALFSFGVFCACSKDDEKNMNGVSLFHLKSLLTEIILRLLSMAIPIITSR